MIMREDREVHRIRSTPCW